MVYCSKHHEVLKYYCQQCKLVICNDCNVSKTHNGHAVALVEEIAEETRRELNEMIEDARKAQNVFNLYINEAKTFLEQVECSKDNSLRVIEDSFEEIFKCLTVSKNKMISHVNDHHMNGLAQVKAAKEQLEGP